MPIHIPAHRSGLVWRDGGDLPMVEQEGAEFLVPLTVRPGVCSRLVVRPGGRVARHELLARPDGPGAVAVFSPVPAVVEGLTTVDTRYAADLPAVRLRLVSDRDWAAGVGQLSSPAGLAIGDMAESSVAGDGPVSGPEDIRRVLADLGRVEDLPAALDEVGVVAGSAGQPEPLGDLLRRAASAQVNLLVVSGLETEPYLAREHHLLAEDASTVAGGIRAVANYLSLRRASLLVSGSQRLPVATVRQIRRHRIRVVAVRTCYPGDADVIVLDRLFGRSIPAGGSSLDARCLMLSVDAAWRVGVALRRKIPVTAQPVTIAGDCLEGKHQGVYLLPNGLTIASLIRLLHSRGMLRDQPRMVILGGSMVGSAVVDPERTVIDAGTGAVLLTGHHRRLRAAACIRCGWCVRCCPMGLDPIGILDGVEARRWDAVGCLGAQRCIGCNVCSHVCPSHLPLAQAVRVARTILE